jgi:hypothetical protein
MGVVIQFRRAVASPEVISKLVKLGYLRPAKRYKRGPIEKALARLGQDLYCAGVIAAGDLSCDLTRMPTESQECVTVTQSTSPMLGSR